jgi:hypothetical protein
MRITLVAWGALQSSRYHFLRLSMGYVAAVMGHRDRKRESTFTLEFAMGDMMLASRQRMLVSYY